MMVFVPSLHFLANPLILLDSLPDARLNDFDDFFVNDLANYIGKWYNITANFTSLLRSPSI